MQIATEHDHEAAIHPRYLQPIGQIISLYEMLKFSAHEFFNIATKLQLIVELFEGVNEGFTQVSSHARLVVVPELKAIGISCEAVGLVYSGMQINRFLAMLLAEPDVTFTYNSAKAIAEDLSLRIQDELTTRLFMQIRNDKAKYYIDPMEMFGHAVLERFPSLGRDIEEAGKCLATERNPGCVYHLMRVMEVGLKFLGDSLALPDTPNRSWDAILKKAGQELAARYKDRSPEWQADEEFYSKATATLHAVKDAWRNPAMHVGTDYSDEVALDIYNAVRGFMRHLAMK